MVADTSRVGHCGCIRLHDSIERGVHFFLVSMQVVSKEGLPRETHTSREHHITGWALPL